MFHRKFFKVSLELKLHGQKDTVVKREPVKIIEIKDYVVKDGKVETLKERSNKVDSIEQKAN